MGTDNIPDGRNYVQAEKGKAKEVTPENFGSVQSEFLNYPSNETKKLMKNQFESMTTPGSDYKEDFTLFDANHNAIDFFGTFFGKRWI